MKIKKSKVSITILTFLLTLMLIKTVAFATNYITDSYNELDPFGYGLEFLSYAGVYEDPAGAFHDVVGTMNRCKIYRNNIKVIDESKTGYLSAQISGSLSSPNYSNAWKMYTETFLKEEGDTYYTIAIGIESNKSN